MAAELFELLDFCFGHLELAISPGQVVSGVLVIESGAHATECRLRLLDGDYEHSSVEISGEFEEELLVVGMFADLRVEIQCEASSFVYKAKLSRENETDRRGVYDLGTIVMK